MSDGPDAVELLEPVVRSIIERLAHGEYEAVVSQAAASRLTASTIRQIIKEYGRTLVVPPVGAFTGFDAVRVRGAIQQEWSVRAPLWTSEEGRSDLTVELTLALSGDMLIFELDDLHVL